MGWSLFWRGWTTPLFSRVSMRPQLWKFIFFSTTIIQKRRLPIVFCSRCCCVFHIHVLKMPNTHCRRLSMAQNEAKLSCVLQRKSLWESSPNGRFFKRICFWCFSDSALLWGNCAKTSKCLGILIRVPVVPCDWTELIAAGRFLILVESGSKSWRLFDSANFDYSHLGCSTIWNTRSRPADQTAPNK